VNVPFELTDIDHVVLRVRDVERMMAFYCDVIGCTVDRVREELGLYQLRAGRSMIDLVRVEGEVGRAHGSAASADSRNMDHFCVFIEPFVADALREHLSTHGVQMGEVKSRYGAQGQGPSVYIEDPEGNIVELKGRGTN
jgi:glyoxylase I family protein